MNSDTGVNDAIFEGDETIIANITGVSGGNGATESGTQTQTVTITDDEVAPLVTLTVNNATIAENAGTSIVTATQSFLSSVNTTVTLAYTGTATSGTDYTGSTTITITAGSLTGTTTITSTNDKYGCGTA